MLAIALVYIAIIVDVKSDDDLLRLFDLETPLLRHGEIFIFWVDLKRLDSERSGFPVIVVKDVQHSERMLEDFHRHFELSVVGLVAAGTLVALGRPWVTEQDAACLFVDSKDGVGMTGDQAIDVFEAATTHQVVLLVSCLDDLPNLIPGQIFRLVRLCRHAGHDSESFRWPAAA